MKKFKREYRFKKAFEVEECFGFGFAISNEQPKKKYKSAYWALSILFVCWHFEFILSYNYKK